MKVEYVLYSILLALASFFYHRYYKWWKKDKIEKRGGLDNYDKGTRTGRMWYIIIMLGVASVIFLLKSLIE